MKKILRLILISKKKIDLFKIFLILHCISLLDIFSIALIIPLIGVISDFDNLIANFPAKNYLFFLTHFSKLEFLIILLISFVVINLIKSLFYLYSNYKIFKFAQNINHYLANLIIRYYLSESYQYLINKKSSVLIRNLTDDAERTQYGILAFLNCFSEIIIAIILLFFIFYIDPISVTIIVSTIFIGVIITKKKITKNLKKWGKVKQSLFSSRIKKISDSLNSFIEIKLTNKINKVINEFSKINLNYQNQILKYTSLQLIPRFIIEIFTIIGISLVLFVQVYKNTDISTILTTLGILAVGSVKLMPSFQKIYTSVNVIAFSKFSINLIYEEINKLEKFNKKNNLKVSNKFTEIKKLDFKNKIHLNNISFKYPKEKKYIIQNCNMIIPKGSTIGIKGNTGSGKSTLIRIIIGLLPPTKGTVTVDKVNIFKKNNKKFITAWHKNISYVPQSIFLINETIKKNIIFDTSDENYIFDEKKSDIRKYKKAIQCSVLQSLIKQLKYKDKTIVGENGVLLSGGQKQRIGIARALYLNRDLLILDESTNSLDHETEGKIIERIKKYKKNLTIILISHKLENYKICDKVYNLKDGKLTQI